MNYAFKDETGKRFGRLRVVKLVSSGRIGAEWLCVCDCGNEKLVIGHNLRKGQVKSCGCLRKEVSSHHAKYNLAHGVIRHGHARKGAATSEYQSWSRIVNRCCNPSAVRWKDYGGRGIKVCDRWKKFDNFIADVGKRPSPDHSIDRIDNDGNYAPENCQWATREQQARNKGQVSKVTDVALQREYDKRFWSMDDPRLWEANYA